MKEEKNERNRVNESAESSDTADPMETGVSKLEEQIEQLRSALTLSERRFREALANAQEILYCYNTQRACYEYISAAAEPVSGYSMEDLLSPGLIPDPLYTIHPQDQPRLRAILEEAERSGEQVFKVPEIEYRRRKKAGGYAWFRDRAAVYLDSEGHIERIVGAATDITDRIRAERALGLSEHMQKALFESGVDPVLICDLDDVTVAVNPAFERFFGYDAEELIGKTFPGHLGHDPGSFEQWVATCRTGRGIQGFETRREAKDGTVHDVSLTISPINDTEGNLLYISISYRDIAKQKKVAGELRQHREQLEELVHARTAELTQVNRHLEEEIAHREMVHNVLNVQRNLGIALSTCENLNEAAHHILAAAFQLDGFDCGAIFLFNAEREGYALAAFEGYTRVPGNWASFFPVQSGRGTRVMGAAAEFGKDQPSLILNPEDLEQEGLNSLTLITIPHAGHIIAVLELASHSEQTVPDWTRTALELIAGQIGKAIAQIQAVEALQVSEIKYRSLTDFIPLTVFETTLTGRFTHVNQHGLDAFGYTAEDIKNGLNFSQILAPGDVEKAQINFQKKIDKEMTDAHEYLCVAKDGKEIPVFIHTAVLEYNKNPIGVRGVALDISDLKRAEENLRQSEERFRSAFDNAPIGVALIDVQGRFLQVNQRFCHMLGYASEDLINTSFKGYVHPRHLEETKRVIQDFMDGRIRAYEGQMQLVHKRGIPIWIVLSVTVQTDETGNPKKVIAHALDITERKQAKAEKAQLEEQLQQLQKLEAIGRLAGGVAHDFNNLLTGMIGHAEIAKQEDLSHARLTGELDGILHLAERGSNLIKQLLTFSRKQVTKPRVIDINQLVRALRRMMRRIIGEDINLQFEPGENLGHVKIDPGQVEQILINLSINARDAMPHGGTLIIKTDNAYLNEQFTPQFPDAKTGRYVLLTIADTGLGMDEETQTQIFEPFFTTKPDGLGTGLGCATVFGIVKQNAGAIKVTSDPGLGTQFNIYLPQTEEPLEVLASNDDQPGKELRARKSETVLVVEDEDQVRKMVVRVLRQYGYNVLEANSGRQALDLCQARDLPVDLVLTDVVMPEMNGPELDRCLRKKWPTLKTLYMSGYAKNYILNEDDLGPGTNYLSKPFRAETLASQVRSILTKTP